MLRFGFLDLLEAQDICECSKKSLAAFVEFQGRFFEVRACAVLFQADGVLLGKATEYDDRDFGGGFILLENLEHVGSGEFWKQHIEKDDIGLFLASDQKGLFAIVGGEDFVAGARKSAFRSYPQKLAVVHQKDLRCS